MKKQLKNADIPPDWTLIDDLHDQRRIGDCTLIMRGYACQRISDQLIVTGSWAGWEESPLDKARLELRERLALVQAMDQSARIWPLLHIVSRKKTGFARGSQLFPSSDDPRTMQFARSNGVASGENFADAARRAAFEIVERHMVLASWYGASRPQACTLPLPAALQSLSSLFDFQHYDFGSFYVHDCGSVFVRGTFLWPLHDEMPVIYGFGAGASEEEAGIKALSEAVQRLAFLDPLDAPKDEPNFSPTPDFHQDYFLHPARKPRLRAWLQGEASHPGFPVDHCRSGIAQALDLTVRGSGHGAVVRVMISGTLPLVFGRFQPLAWPKLPADFLIHPIV
ncbi:MAG TPA: YcaO-like family protein [Oligoflexus sp.]|uniref:YcaO-like family protein n=1 Tax=Oligoflexus sp. TaxID=1971216 RepID=UPI002D7F5145|nr:YcaO-like family protein [Oligoflexus sp.]HET9237169.1 YcaO-like family protein [Oligoflexus sp.]